MESGDEPVVRGRRAVTVGQACHTIALSGILSPGDGYPLPGPEQVFWAWEEKWIDLALAYRLAIRVLVYRRVLLEAQSWTA